MNKNTLIALVVAVVIIIVGAVAILHTQSSPIKQIQPETRTTKLPAKTVTLTANGFTPATITIKAGNLVVWKNDSGQVATVNSNPHPIHTDYPPLNLGQFANESSLQLAFPKPGKYGYHNHLNPSQTGTVVVQ